MFLPRKDSFAAIAPYATWMALMWLLPATAASYAVRTAATLLALIPCACFLFRATRQDASSPYPASPKITNDKCKITNSKLPQSSNSIEESKNRRIKKFSPSPQSSNSTEESKNRKIEKFSHRLPSLSTLNFQLLTGALVALLWIAPEYSSFYREWFIFGSAPDPAVPGAAPSPYDPAVCGWTLFWVRLAGSAFVIAPVEELFFRSYLYRRLQGADWRSVPRGRFDFAAFAWMVALFSLEHNRILAAAVAGAIYGAIYIRHGFLCAAVSHSVTNLALGLYVLRASAWSFW